MHKKAYEHTKFFVENCGIRVAGTQSVIKASDYICEYFKTCGIQTECHDFKVPVCSVKQSQLKFKIGDTWCEIKHTPALFSRETPENGITLPLIYVENGSVANLKAKDVKGKAVLICRDVYMVYPDIFMYKKLYDFGAAAVVYTTNDGHSDVPFVYANFETMNDEYTLPTAVIHYCDALELAKAESVEIYYNAQFEITEGASRNTIGTIPGTDEDGESIIVCAHLDSAVSSVGATDDVAGVAILMELAKYYQEYVRTHGSFRRTIRFIAWSGHECGLHGSKYYLLDHPEVFKRTKFVLNYDVVGNALSNYSILAGCCEEVEKTLNKIIGVLELEWPVTVAPMVVDTLNFAVKQIPQLTLTAGFYGGNHTRNDNMDLISEEGFVTPISFSKAIIEWAGNADEIKQGYPEDLNEGMRFTGDMYGWGLFHQRI